MHDILKDPNKRKHYNNVLDNGLPDWKQAIYYYRSVRKMGLREMSVILFIIITIGQYLYSWAAYFERKLNVVSAFYLIYESNFLKIHLFICI